MIQRFSRNKIKKYFTPKKLKMQKQFSMSIEVVFSPKEICYLANQYGDIYINVCVHS